MAAARNISIVKGDSGTGKTTLFNMISDYTAQGLASGVKIKCSKKCEIISSRFSWRDQLEGISDSVVFIDEGVKDISSEDFAAAVKNSDNYYVIFLRETLHNLPFSVDAIYKIETVGKKHIFVKFYDSDKKN